MKLTIDISLYPLTEDFIPVIKEFIGKIEKYDSVSVLKNNISTQVSGDYDTIMHLLSNELKPVFQKMRSVFVVKFLVGDKIND
ncbi:MAG: YkoF family thiamine/hydroxymethylpyrimidine-binding protein [Candidatus Kapaibacterium sp.]